MPRRTLPFLVTLIALAAPAGAQAAVFGGDVIDGPSPDLLSVGEFDVARDGTGAVTYLKQVDGVPHVFVSRLVGGAFTPPERIDAALPAGAAQPVVAASDGGRIAVAFTSGGALHTVLRPNAATPFGGPQGIANAVSNPSIDMSINGVAYVSFTAPGASAADVRVARLARDGQSFALLPDVLDINPAAEAGAGEPGHSRVAVSADGTAVVIWGEADHVYARRVFGTRVSAAPQDLNVATLDGHAGGAANTGQIDIEDDSSYAWATFRQAFDDGRAHVVARRLVGSAFEAPVFVDGLGYPAGADATETAIEINGRGEGIAATGAGQLVNASILHEDVFNPGLNLGVGNGTSHPAVGIAENNDAYAAWIAADGSVQQRAYDIDPKKRLAPPPLPAAPLSNPAFGPVSTGAGMDMVVNRAGDSAAVFIQQGADGLRLVSGGFDREPGTFRTYTTAKFRSFARPPLSWQPSFELLGKLTYRVEIDGQPVGETQDTKLTTANPVADGVHTWRVVATDRRGQVTTAPARTLRIDSVPPALTFKVTGKRQQRQQVKVAVTAADGSLTAPAGSGIKTVKIDFGDKTRVVSGRTASHRYAKNGRYTVRVSATDLAGNAVAKTLAVTIKKKK